MVQVKNKGMKRDYYWEFIELVDEILNTFIESIKTKMPEALCFNGVSLERSVLITLSYHVLNNKNRDYYNLKRKAGESRELLYNQFIDFLTEHYIRPELSRQMNEIKADNEAIEKAYFDLLNPYRDCYIYYCFNYRQFKYMLPLFEHAQQVTSIILSEQSLPDDVELDEHIVVLEIDSIITFHNRQRYLQHFFPRLFRFAGIFDLILKYLSPRGVIFLEGSHDSSTVLNALCQAKEIPTFCIQQGWPSVVHSRFRNMKYNYYLTWGPEYNRLWKKYNPFPDFIDVGYLYKVTDNKTDNGITFFLQSPVYIIDEVYFNELLELARHCAQDFPNRTVYIREHPEYRLTEAVKTDLNHYRNVRFVTEDPLQEVFARTEIAVAIFSSTLMEGIIHHTIPFVFDPCFNHPWYPDIEKQGLGIIAKSLPEAKRRIKELLLSEEKRTTIKKQSASLKKEYCTAIADRAVENYFNCLITLTSKDPPS